MPTFLHVGCGPKRKDATTSGFNTSQWAEVRLDIDPGAKPDILGSMTDMGAVADGRHGGLFSSHNIEHLYPFEVPIALGIPPGAERRRLRGDHLSRPAIGGGPGGRGPADGAGLHLARGPDLAARHPLRPPADLARGNLYMAHRTGFTSRTLEAALRAAGFAKVVMLRRPRALDLWALASKSARAAAELRPLVAEHFPLQGGGPA